MITRHRLMEIENHILSLTMEFEKQNIIISEWEAEKAKNAGDRKWHRKQQRKLKGDKDLYKKNKVKHKKKKNNENKPSSASSTNSILLQSNGQIDELSKKLPKIVIQPSLSDNDEENEGTHTQLIFYYSVFFNRDKTIFLILKKCIVVLFHIFYLLNSAAGHDDDDAATGEHRQENEVESGFEDEVDESNDGSSGEEGK